jgi:hypothetical protein
MGTSFTVAVFPQTVRGSNAIETGVIFTAATLGVLASSLAAERLAKGVRRNADRGRLQGDRRRNRAPAGRGRRVVASRRLRARTAVDRPRALGHADPSVNIVQSSFPEQRQDEISGALAQRLEPRLVLWHRGSRHDPGLRPRLGQHDLRTCDGRARRCRPHQVVAATRLPCGPKPPGTSTELTTTHPPPPPIQRG